MNSNDSQELKLIDGDFSAEDTLRIIDAMLTAKINFHQSRQFAHSIKGTADSIDCGLRVQQLRETRQQFMLYIDRCKTNNQKVSVLGNITMTAHAPTPATEPMSVLEHSN